MIDKKIAIVCGSGNNGGDGYALACILLDNNTTPHIFTIADRFSRDGKYYYDLAVSKGALCTAFSKIIDFSAYDIVVDCIFGTGFKGCPKNLAKDAINAINKSGAYIISADINSGLNGDTGRSEIAVKSDLTVSIGYYKKGMFLEDAPSLIKDLVNVDIGIVKI